jgi:hypothetical protein
MAEYIDKEKILKMTTSYKNELGRLKADPFVKCGIETVEKFINEQPTADVIPIPEGATNGDMIKAMFPNVQIREVCRGELIEFTLDGVVGTTVTKGCWNAPYKRGNKNEIID